MAPWDWEYFYTSKRKDWDNCDTKKKRREWREMNCRRACEQTIDGCKIRFYPRSAIDPIKNDILAYLGRSSWQMHRLLPGRFKRKLEAIAKASLKAHSAELASFVPQGTITIIEQTLPDVIAEIVEGFQTWTAPIFCRTKPDDIIAWEFGTTKPKPRKKDETSGRSVFGEICERVHLSLSYPSAYVALSYQIEESLGVFLKSRLPPNKIRMFRPSKEELERYLLRSVTYNDRCALEILVKAYGNAYEEAMPVLCGLFGEYGMLNKSRRKEYARCRNVEEVERKILSQIAKMPIDFTAYFDAMRTSERKEAASYEVTGGATSEQEVLEEVHDLILEVVKPALAHITKTAIARAEMSRTEWHPMPRWDERFRSNGDTRGGGYLLEAAEDIDAAEKVIMRKTFEIEFYDAKHEILPKGNLSSKTIYQLVYHWYWEKSKEIFDREVSKAKLWGKKAR